MPQSTWSRLLVEPRRLPSVRERPNAHWLAVAAVCVGALMGQLDASIVTVALPSLQKSFHSSVGSVTWVGLSYLVVLVATVTAFGRFADMWGRKLLYVYGFVIFIVGSALCGLAPDLPALCGFPRLASSWRGHAAGQQLGHHHACGAEPAPAGVPSVCREQRRRSDFPSGRRWLDCCSPPGAGALSSSSTSPWVFSERWLRWPWYLGVRTCKTEQPSTGRVSASSSRRSCPCSAPSPSVHRRGGDRRSSSGSSRRCRAGDLVRTP